MVLDTTFLIDLHREAKRGEPGKAFRFLEANPDAPMLISIITFAEFAEGFPLEKRDECIEVLKPYQVININQDIAWVYARTSRALRERGIPTGDNDLWIACTAVHLNALLVTRDQRHFDRISELKIVSY